MLGEQGGASGAGPAATTATAAAEPATATAAADSAALTSPVDPAAVAAGPAPAAGDAAAVGDPGAGPVPGSPAVATAEARAPARAPRWAYLPYAIVLAATACGLSWVALGGLRHVRAGMMTVASALLVAAVLRLVLPGRAAGLLVSRRRVLDVLALAGLGACLMAAVLVLPSPA